MKYSKDRVEKGLSRKKNCLDKSKLAKELLESLILDEELCWVRYNVECWRAQGDWQAHVDSYDKYCM